MTLTELLASLLLAAVAWLVWDGLKAREAANAAMRAACKAEALLFLDDTVALESMWPVGNDAGRLTLRRVYGFEYSDTGDNRRKGSVTLIGDRVWSIDIGSLSPRSGETMH